MEGKKKKIIIGISIGIAALFIVFGTLACLGIFREFDAQGYVKATLDQTIKGEVEAAVEITSGSTEEELYAQYESGIESFVKNSLTSGTELTEDLEARYIELCKKVFASMKYEVQEAEKISDTEYQVPVTYQPSDVLNLFIALVQEESTRLKEKADKGEEYRGTLDEINAQMKSDFMNNSCDLFEEAYNNMQYGEEKTMVFKVAKGENGLYELESSEISEFLTKILGLGENQD